MSLDEAYLDVTTNLKNMPLASEIAREIRARITGFAAASQGAVLWTSHNMYEVAEVCERVLFLSHGRILLAGAPDALIAEHGDATLEDLFVRVANEALSPAQAPA